MSNTLNSLHEWNKYLERVFYKNNYITDLTNRHPAPVTTVAILYIKGTSETISWIMQLYNICVAHKATSMLRHFHTNIKDRDKPNNRQGQFTRSKCSDCQTGRREWLNTTDEPRELVMLTIISLYIINWQITTLTETLYNACTYIMNYFHWLTLESCWTNLQQMPCNRCQPLPAPYYAILLIHYANKTNRLLTDQLNLTNNTQTSNRWIKTDLWLMTNFAWVFHDIITDQSPS